MTYAYLNGLLDANPGVTLLKLCADAYAAAIGPVPDGQTDIKTRCTVEAQPDDAVPSLCLGLDAAGAVLVQFYC